LIPSSQWYEIRSLLPCPHHGFPVCACQRSSAQRRRPTDIIPGLTFLKKPNNPLVPLIAFNIIFNQGNNKPQTSDIQRLTADKYFTATISGGKVAYTDVTSTTGISHIDAPAAADTDRKARVITDGQGIFIEQPDGTRYTLDGKKAN